MNELQTQFNDFSITRKENPKLFNNLLDNMKNLKISDNVDNEIDNLLQKIEKLSIKDKEIVLENKDGSIIKFNYSCLIEFLQYNPLYKPNYIY